MPLAVTENRIGCDEMMCLSKRYNQFSPIDSDIGDIQSVLRHLGTEDDKSPMSVRRGEASLVSFGEEAVFAAFEMVAKPSFEHSGEGQTLF